MDSDLIGLCRFSPLVEWSLVYRASEQGFSAADFHSFCDNKVNTLTIVKTTRGCVFGGFTQCKWKPPTPPNIGYKFDQLAFIFSLVNGDNTPVKMNTLDGHNAIFCKSTQGPTFGYGHDLCISDNSNCNEQSFSRLGLTHAHPTYAYGSAEAKCFLAGSEYFQVAEIEVFQSI
jgi:hypothetical protein